MLLAVDAGNTDTVIGLYDRSVVEPKAADDGLLDHWRIATHAERTADEHAVMFQGFLATKRHSWLDDIEGIVISSGVPRVTSNLRNMAERYLGQQAVVLEPGTRTGVSIRYENPREVGADRIANAVAAVDLYGGPAVVIDFGTATTYDAVSANGELLGCAIAPGVDISLDALYQRADALRRIELVEPRNVIGRNTIDSLQAGAVYGFAGQVDGITQLMIDELGGRAKVVATGGLASLIAPHTRTIEVLEPWLTLHGLRLVWERNQ